MPPTDIPTGPPDDVFPDESPAVDIPAESAIIDQAYRRSGLTHSALAIATGMSVGAVRIALAGVRYRHGRPVSVRPKDEPLAKLASVLGLDPRQLSLVGRDRAAQMMSGVDIQDVDLEAPAAVASRRALAQQVLAAFSTEELRAEIDRRDSEMPDVDPE